MTHAQALAKLIDNAPELAGEVMPEGYHIGKLGSVLRYDSEYGHDVPMSPPFVPTWFYQAVAGKLAEWLAERDVFVRKSNTEYCSMTCTNFRDVEQTGGCHLAPTYFAALVEAAIAVHNAA